MNSIARLKSLPVVDLFSLSESKQIEEIVSRSLLRPLELGLQDVVPIRLRADLKAKERAEIEIANSRVYFFAG